MSRDQPARAGLVAAAGLALAACAWGIWTLRRRVLVVTVAGESMRPTYADGDHVLVRRAQLGELRCGQVVVVEKPAAGGQWTTPPVRWPADARNWMVKRVRALPGDPCPDVPCPDVPGPALPFRSKLAGLAGQPVPPGKLVILGDNPGGSFDSRAFGYYPADRVLGVVVRPLRARQPRAGHGTLRGRAQARLNGLSRDLASAACSMLIRMMRAWLLGSCLSIAR